MIRELNGPTDLRGGCTIPAGPVAGEECKCVCDQRSPARTTLPRRRGGGQVLMSARCMAAVDAVETAPSLQVAARAVRPRPAMSLAANRHWLKRRQVLVLACLTSVVFMAASPPCPRSGSISGLRRRWSPCAATRPTPCRGPLACSLCRRRFRRIPANTRWALPRCRTTDSEKIPARLPQGRSRSARSGIGPLHRGFPDQVSHDALITRSRWRQSSSTKLIQNSIISSSDPQPHVTVFGGSVGL